MSAALAVALAQDVKLLLTEYSKTHPEPLGEPFSPVAPTVTQPSYLLWMCDEIIRFGSTWPATKLHRWVGYMQGCMVALSVTTLDEERTRVRVLKEVHPEVDHVPPDYVNNHVFHPPLNPRDAYEQASE